MNPCAIGGQYLAASNHQPYSTLGPVIPHRGPSSASTSVSTSTANSISGPPSPMNVPPVTQYPSRNPSGEVQMLAPSSYLPTNLNVDQGVYQPHNGNVYVNQAPTQVLPPSTHAQVPQWGAPPQAPLAHHRHNQTPANITPAGNVARGPGPRKSKINLTEHLPPPCEFYHLFVHSTRLIYFDLKRMLLLSSRSRLLLPSVEAVMGRLMEPAADPERNCK